METTRFYIEDLCCLKADTTKTGIVERTVHDVDQHIPFPQRQYDRDILRNRDISRHEFDRFMRSGIPPPGSVLIEWVTKEDEGDLELIPSEKLKLLDRSFVFGDIVKKSTEDAMSGTVIDTETSVGLVPPPALYLLQEYGPENLDLIRWKSEGDLQDMAERHAASKPCQLLNIPAEELRSASTYIEGDMVLYRDWVGRVEDIDTEVYVQLSNGSVVIPQDTDDLEIIDNPIDDRPEVGFMVKAKKNNLRRGRWVRGAYDPNVDLTGVVVHTATVRLIVHWLCRRLDGPQARVCHEPPIQLTQSDLVDPEFHLYDRSRCPEAGPVSKRACCVDVIPGNTVRFRDPEGAALKYDGSRVVELANRQLHRNHFRRSSSSLGYDLNVFNINSTTTLVRVFWQDLTSTVHVSTELVPDFDLDDESIVWPGEIVTTVQRKTPVPDTAWVFSPERVGVVQAVNAADRVANVRWLPEASIFYHNIADMDESYSGALIPGSSTGIPSTSGVVEEISVYDVRLASGINKRRGDFVMLHPPAHSNLDINKTATLDWFGEVIDLGLDGLLTVRLGALDRVRDIKIAPEYATLAYSSDITGDLGNEHEDSIDDTLSDLSDIYSNLSHLQPGAELALQQWYEYSDANGNTTVVPESDDATDEGAWLTEDDEEGQNNDNNAVSGNPHSNSRTNPPTSDLITSSGSTSQARPRRSSRINPSTVRQNTSEPALISPTMPARVVNFQILEGRPPLDCPYNRLEEIATPPATFFRTVSKEHKILSSSLPPGIFVRSWETRLDILRVLIVGPLDTPYEFAPFMIDMKLPHNYPQSPPEAHFHSWTDGQGPVNPNLYENGKICLSLLGTWHADSSTENWTPGKSTILQILVSILGLVLVREPYYNEAGFEARAGTIESKLPSKLYSERAYFRSRRFITAALENKPEGITDVLEWLYLKPTSGEQTPCLLQRAIESAKDIISRSEWPDPNNRTPMRAGLNPMTKGALVMLKRQLAAMEALPGTAPGNTIAVDSRNGE